MDSEIIDAVTGWDSAPSGRGYGGLRSLADDGFSGSVVAGMTWGFMLNGRLLGVFDGTIADFDDESFEAYRAPHESLPLLYTMRETGGDVRAQYYTEDTPLSDANGTLSAGGFTGYVELSENVLSGDYYVVYHGGKSMSAAFVGNSKRLVTGDEAFDLADDEIGIYKVYDVDIDLVEIPDDETDEAEPEATPTAAAAGSESVSDREDDASDEPQSPATSNDSVDSETASDSESVVAEAEPAEAVASSEESESEVQTEASAEPSPSTSASDASSQATTHVSKAESTDTDASPTASASSPSSAAASSSSSSGSNNGSSSDDDASGDDVFSAEAEWRNARSIPSLDPRDSEGESVEDRAGAARGAKRGQERSARSRTSTGQRAKQSKNTARRSSKTTKNSKQSAKSANAKSAATTKEAQTLKKRLSEVESERDRLESERDALQKERDEHQSRAEKLDRRVNELEAEVDRLQSELDDAGVTATDRSMPADEALRGTNLFVRYGKKSGATLEKAHAGQSKREDVVENLRLEHHTTFDTDGLGVDGRPYEEFLHETPEFGFAKWAVTDLLYEIGETDNRSSLAGVFDSIPKADRIELYGTVSVPIGEDETEARKFDVIFRDQMGNPLFVANLNDSRDPATYAKVQQLINDSKAVAEANESLGSAFVVTKSFFEPEALEAATAETGGGLLSRSKRKSFVKLSRKQGYHLCLVEARSGEFHLNVPDL